MTTELAKRILEGEIVEHWSKRLNITINLVQTPGFDEAMAQAKKSLLAFPPRAREVMPMLDGDLDDKAIDM